MFQFYMYRLAVTISVDFAITGYGTAFFFLLYIVLANALAGIH